MTILRVGTDKTFTTITSAYIAAANGDTLLIDAGTYNELLDFNNKVVNIIGNVNYPALNEVVITYDSRVSTNPLLKIRYVEPSVPITMVIQGVTLYSCVYGLTKALVSVTNDSGAISPLTICFNQCTLVGTTGVNNYVIDSVFTTYGITKLEFIHSKVTWSVGDFFISPGYISTTIKNLHYTILFSSPSIDFTERVYILDSSGDQEGYGVRYGNELITRPVEYCFSGTVTVNTETPVQSEVKIFRGDNNRFLASTISNENNGSYYVELSFGGECSLICSPVSTPYRTAIWKTKCSPRKII